MFKYELEDQDSENDIHKDDDEKVRQKKNLSTISNFCTSGDDI